MAFRSGATNLIAGGTNSGESIFVRDLQTGTTSLVTMGIGGAPINDFLYDPVISADGRFVAFWSQASNLVPGDTNRDFDVFVRDRQTGTTARVSVGPGGRQANGSSGAPSISAKGRFVAFDSNARNLVAGDGNGANDVFVHDRQTGVTTRVSTASGGAQADGDSFEGHIAPDGHDIAFSSQASNLVPNDTNFTFDVFVRNH